MQSMFNTMVFVVIFVPVAILIIVLAVNLFRLFAIRKKLKEKDTEEDSFKKP
jgi:hypothetical protein